MSILYNKNNVNVSQNEIITKHSINRNFNKLLDNDKQLNLLFTNVLAKIGQINEYSPIRMYTLGERIFYKTYFDNKFQIFILKSTRNGNNTEPVLEILENQISFINSNWEIEWGALENLKEVILAECRKIVTNKLITQHNYKGSFHKFGEIKNVEDVDKKLLKHDFTNIDPKRSNIFYPHKTYSVPQDNVVRSGFYRQWDNGLIEYSIIYKLGYQGQEEYKKVLYDNIQCNNLKIEENSYKYFFKPEDREIFNKKEPENIFSIFNGMKQNNRNKFVNIYTGKIKFPVPFINTNYMIFGNTLVCQQRNLLDPKLYSSTNSMTYVNKTVDSVMPLYITFPLDDDPSNSGLITNTFQCNIVGRWK